MKKIPLNFYQQEDVLFLSKSLIGKYLFTCLGPENVITGGMIVETEGYKGTIDKACHAYGGRRTKRTETLYTEGGVAYIYLCYGMHHLFNIVTNQKDIPEAVLIRAIRPEVGIEIMLKRRKKEVVTPSLTSGPGSLCQALGITKEQDCNALDGNSIWLEDRGTNILPHQIKHGPRIGVAYAEEDALKPWRFYL